MPKKKVDLATAKVADGALVSGRSVYEICGNRYSKYKTADLNVYRKTIAAMNLLELQDHAYEVGVTANQDRRVLVDRLEQEFRRHNVQLPRESAQPEGEHSLRDQAMQILSRGR